MRRHNITFWSLRFGVRQRLNVLKSLHFRGGTRVASKGNCNTWNVPCRCKFMEFKVLQSGMEVPLLCNVTHTVFSTQCHTYHYHFKKQTESYKSSYLHVRMAGRWLLISSRRSKESPNWSCSGSNLKLWYGPPFSESKQTPPQPNFTLKSCSRILKIFRFWFSWEMGALIWGIIIHPYFLFCWEC